MTWAKKAHRAGRKVFIAASGSVYQDPPACQALISFLQEDADAVVFHGDQSRFAGERPAGRIEEHQVRYPEDAPRQLRGLLYALRYRRALNRELFRHRPEIFISVMHLPLAVASGAALRQCRLRIAAVLDVMPWAGNGRFEDFLHRRFWRRLSACPLAWASDPGKVAEALRRTGGATKLFICFNSPVLGFARSLENSGIAELSAACDMPETTLRKSSSVMVRAGAIAPDSALEATIAGMQYAPADAILIALGQPGQEYHDRLRNLAQVHRVEKRVAVIQRPTDKVWRQALSVANIGHMLLIIPKSGYAREKWELNSPLSHNRLFQYMAAGLPILASEDARLRAFAGDSAWLHSLAGERHDPEQIGREWTRISGSRGLRHAAGEQARMKFVSSYHWEKQFAPVRDEAFRRLTWFRG